jgi:hypothetical protein
VMPSSVGLLPYNLIKLKHYTYLVIPPLGTYKGNEGGGT